LKAQVEKDPDGFVDIALLCSFTRVALLLNPNVAYQQRSHHSKKRPLVAQQDPNSVPKDIVSCVAKLLKDGCPSLVVSDDLTRVRRATALPPAEDIAKDIDSRSIFASPFPFNTSLDELTDLFQALGDVKSIRLRRHLASKDFRGSIFIEFSSKEEAAKVLEKELVHQGAPIKLEWKAEYLERKEAEKEIKRAELKALQAAQAAQAEAEATAAATNGTTDTACLEEGETANGHTYTSEELDAIDLGHYRSGCVIHFDYGKATNFSIAPIVAVIKDSFGDKLGGVKYVDYLLTGSKQGYVHFKSPEDARDAIAKFTRRDSNGNYKMMIAGYEATVKILGPDEEEKPLKLARLSFERVKTQKMETAGIELLKYTDDLDRAKKGLPPVQKNKG
jgi:lupus La protein